MPAAKAEEYLALMREAALPDYGSTLRRETEYAPSDFCDIASLRNDSFRSPASAQENSAKKRGICMKIIAAGVAATFAVALSLSAGPSAPGHSQALRSKAQAQSASQCQCYISANYIVNQPTPTNAIHAVGLAGSGTCKARCIAGTVALNKQVEADALCHPSVNIPNGSNISSYYNDGTANFQLATGVGTLTNTPLIPSSQWKCPATWNSNTSNQLGGITTDGRCKKLAGSISGISAPANGTQLGSWGFTWGNEVWAYGNSANGGAAFHPSTPAQCHF